MAIGPQCVDVGVVERGERRIADDPTQQLIGECWVAGERRTMQIGADHGTVDDTLGAIAVALTNLDPTKCRGAWARGGATGVVLEPGERAERPHGAIG